MGRKLPRMALLPVFLAVAGAVGATIDEGVGVIYGNDHAFGLKAPKGWVLDNTSGVSQGARAVFYPKGETWQKSPAVASARARTRTKSVSSAEDQVQDTLRDFHQSGSPHCKAEKAADIKAGGKTAVVYRFTGDKWGNSEAIAYFVEDKTINFIVFNAGDDGTFRKFFPAFEELVKSYRFLGDHPGDKAASGGAQGGKWR